MNPDLKPRVKGGQNSLQSLLPLPHSRLSVFIGGSVSGAGLAYNTLEYEASGELDLPPELAGLLGYDPTEIRRVPVEVRISRGEPVHHVIGLAPKFELQPVFRQNRKLLTEGGIEIYEARPLQVVELKRIRAPGERGLHRENGRVEPLSLCGLVHTRIAVYQQAAKAQI